MKKNPHVSILLATHNGQEFIAEQIQSITSQIGISIRIIVSDDVSGDNTIGVLRSVIDEDLDISILPTRKSGSASKNFFRLIIDSNLSKTDYVAFSDQDDIWNKDKLSSAIHSIKKNNVDGYSSNVIAFWPNDKQRLINKAQKQRTFDYMFESAGPGCTFVLSQKLALDLQSFLRVNQQLCESIELHDWFTYAFARSRGYKWFIDPMPNMLYRQHTHNVLGANTGLKAYLARLKTLRHGWYIQQILLTANALSYQDKMPIKRIHRLDFVDKLYLAIHTFEFRRRLRDQFAFALFILFLIRKP